MPVLRVLTIIASVVLLGTALLLWYAQRNLASLSEAQIERWLADQGVEEVTLGDIGLSRDHLTLASLHLSGKRDGLLFAVDLQKLRADYSIASLRRAELISVQVDQVAAELERRSPATTGSGTPRLRLSNWLSEPVNTLLPLETLALENIQLSYRSGSVPHVEAQGRLQVGKETALSLAGVFAAGEWRLTLDIADGGVATGFTLGNVASSEQFLQLSGALGPALTQRWLAEINLGAQHAALLRWVGQAASELGNGQLASAIAPLSVAGQSRLEAALTLPDLLPLDTLLAGRVPQDLELESQLQSEFPDIAIRDTLHSGQGSLQLQLQHALSRWNSNTSGTLRGNVPRERLPVSAAMLAKLGWQEDVPFSLQLGQGLELSTALTDRDTWLWEAALREAEITLGTGNTRVRLAALTAEARPDAGLGGPLALSAKTTLQGLLNSRKLPPLPLTLEHSGSLQASRYRLNVRDEAASISLQLAGTANLREGSGEHNLALNIPDLGAASDSANPLLQRFELMQSPPDLTAGSLQLDSQLSTAGFDMSGWRQRATLLVEGVSGTLADIAFTDLALDAAWQGIEYWQTTRPLQLSIAQLEPGFSITGLEASIQLPESTPIASPSMTLQSFSAKLFGGRVLLKNSTTWDFGATRNSMKLHAENWSLAELVALQTNRNIQAQGRLNGELPVVLHDSRIIIQSGFLRSAPPGGTIRYQPETSTASMAAGSSELNMALDLLRDFRFDQLSSSVDLDESGELTLGLALSGHNPAQQRGRTINFNINVQQNIDPLLQSLRMGDNLLQDIEGGLR